MKNKEKRMKEFGEFLAKLRKAKNVSVRDVAKEIQLSDPYLYQVESGKKALTDPESFNKLAKYFEIDVKELLEKAGYIIGEEDEEQKVDKVLQHIKTDPEFKYGTRLSGKLDLNTKKFIIEMYEKATGKKLLE